MRGPVSYIGGKSRLAKVIIDRLPPHTAYVEPFAGGAKIFFFKSRSKVEVLNDLDGDLVNFYRVCQSHYQELVRYLRFMIVSREWFQRLLETPPEALTDIQRAGRYLYLQKNAYGARVTRKAYAIHVSGNPNFNPESLEKVLAETHERLARVQIENLSYEKVLKLYDRPETLFYLDPPYFGIRLYRHNLEHEDFEKMAERLKSLKGKFLLSINDHPEVRRLFAAFEIRKVPITYSVHGGKRKQIEELLISNYSQVAVQKEKPDQFDPAGPVTQRSKAQRLAQETRGH
jgi:DNA adenine methylase